MNPTPMEEKDHSPKDMARADFLTAILLLVFSVSVVVLSYQMPRFQHRGANPWSAPGVVPGALGIIIGILAVTLLLRSIRQQGHVLSASKESFFRWLPSPASRRLWLTLLLTLGYAWGLVGRIPYIWATWLFISLFIVAFEYDRAESRDKKLRRIVSAVFMGLVTSVAVALLFERGFLVRLP